MKMTGRAWAYLGAILGAGVSIAANVAHSYVPPAGVPAGWRPHFGAVIGAVFWPIALLVAVEILARVAWPAGLRWWALRLGGLVPVAVVAAVVSYRHLSGLLDFYGEDRLTYTIGPLAVDGLMVMATGALVATGRKARDAEQPAPAVKIEKLEVGKPEQEPPSDPWRYATPAPVARPAVSGPPPFRLPEPALAPLVSVPITPPSSPTAVATPSKVPIVQPVKPVRATPPAAADKGEDNASRIAKARQRRPAATQAQIAEETGVSVRTVARYWTPVPVEQVEPVGQLHAGNGGPVPVEALDDATELTATVPAATN